MKEQPCAPIIIPTLNRYEHFRNCVESLQKNRYAEYTDIYISVDYPPSVEYNEGYQKICYYLNHEFKSNFKKTYIFYQTKNLGPELNTSFLVDKSRDSSNEYFIFTEDDNIFSPIFLEYINTCLRVYQYNPQIMAIGGYCDPLNWRATNGLFILDETIAWGTAFYRSRLDSCINWINYNNLIGILKNSQKCKELFNYNYKKYWILVEACISDLDDKKNVFVRKEEKDIRAIDYTEGLYMTFNKCYAVYPSTTLVHNNGYDGSGVNCPKINETSNQSKLITWNDFDYIATPNLNILPANQQINNNHIDCKRAKRARVLRLVFLFFGKTAAQKCKKITDYFEYKLFLIKNHFHK